MARFLLLLLVLITGISCSDEPAPEEAKAFLEFSWQGTGNIVFFKKTGGYKSEDGKRYIMEVEYGVLLKKGIDDLIQELTKKILPPDIEGLMGDMYEVLSLYKACGGELKEGDVCKLKGLVVFEKTKSGWAIREEDTILFR